MLLTIKGYVKPDTVVCAFCGGWIIDFFVGIRRVYQRIICAGAVGHFDAGGLYDSGVWHVCCHQKQLRNRAQRPNRDDFQRQDQPAQTDRVSLGGESAVMCFL